MPESLALLEALAADVSRRHSMRLLAIKGDSLVHHRLRVTTRHADIDVLVSPDDVDAYLETMADIGWRPRMGRFNDYPVRNHSVTLINDHWSVDLDVHRLFPGFLQDPQVVFDELWARREEITASHQPVEIPDYSSSALILALHSARSRAENPRHAAELRHLIELSANWSPERRADVSALAIATGCSQSLEAVLTRMGVSAGHADGASPRELRRWNAVIEGRSSSLQAWRRNLQAQPIAQWPGLLLHGIWPSEEYLRATNHLDPGDPNVNRVRRRRLLDGAERACVAALSRLGLGRPTPVSEATSLPMPEQTDPAPNQLVSIVIPVHDSAPYLEECLSSVLAQTHTNLEAICIDDGSTDGSADLLDRIADTDHRVRVVRRGHRGVGATRNTGILEASGELLTFVDSDDVVAPTLVEALVGALGDADVAMCGWRGEARLIDGPEAVAVGLRDGCLNTTGKLLRVAILREQGIAFDEGLPIREDIVFNVAYLLGAGPVQVIPDALYLHRPRPGSLTTSFRPDKYRELMLADAQLTALTHHLRNPEFASLLNYLRIRSLISAGLNLRHPDSPASCAESDRLLRKWQGEQGGLPVRHGSPPMRLTGLLYRTLGLVGTTALADRLRRLRAFLAERRRVG